MKKLIVVFTMLICTQVATAAVVYDPTNHKTRLLELAEQIVQLKTQIDHLSNITGVSEILDFIDLPVLAEIRKHIPDAYIDLLALISEHVGGGRAIEELIELLGSDEHYSKDATLEAVYLYQLENLKKSKGYSAADHEAAAARIKEIDNTIAKSDGFETQKARDGAQIKITGEVAKGQQEILMSLSNLTDLIATSQTQDHAMQKNHIIRSSKTDSLQWDGK